MLSNEINTLQNELAQERQIKNEEIKEYTEKIVQLKERIKKEKSLRVDSNTALDKLNRKVRDLEEKYHNELWYYKELAEKKDEDHMRTKKVLEKENYKKHELEASINKLELENRRLKPLLLQQSQVSDSKFYDVYSINYCRLCFLSLMKLIKCHAFKISLQLNNQFISIWFISLL